MLQQCQQLQQELFQQHLVAAEESCTGRDGQGQLPAGKAALAGVLAACPPAGFSLLLPDTSAGPQQPPVCFRVIFGRKKAHFSEFVVLIEVEVGDCQDCSCSDTVFAPLWGCPWEKPWVIPFLPLQGIGNTFQGGANCIMFVLCTRVVRARLLSLLCCGHCDELHWPVQGSSSSWQRPRPHKDKDVPGPEQTKPLLSST